LSPFIRNLTAALLVATITVPATFAQSKKNADEPRMIETIDVRVINVDVVVTDRKGNAVPNLKASDFEIYENGVAKPVSNFYEIVGNQTRMEPEGGGPATLTPAPSDVSEKLKRRVIFYIDNLSLAPFNRNRVFTQMKEFVKTVLRPGDEAMIATYNRSMKIRVPFTRDVNQINTMLDQLATESGLGIAARSERQSTEDRIRDARSYEEAIATARAYASSVEHDLRQSVASLSGLMTTLAGVEGKKILVLTSEGFPMQPGREAFYFIDEQSREKGWSNVGATMLEPMSYDGTRFVQSVAKTANANGITMYTVHAAGLQGGSDMSAEHSQAVSSTVTQAAISNTTESMQLMAEMTGGLASVQTNNFAEAFKRIQRDLESYYSLGYRAGTERVDRQRYLQVKVKQKGLTVRSRQTFVEKSMFAEMSDRVIANLLYKGKDNDMKILARIGSPRPTEDGYYQVPMDIQIPMESLTLLPQGDAGESVGGFEIYVAVADKDGDMSDVSRKSHQVRVSAEDMKTIKGKYYTYTLDMLMARGLNKISVGVVDSISNETGFAREQIIAQDLR
jgi:VWFA-related protein